MRLRDQVLRPRLFNDLMPAGRVRARGDRFRRWCGPMLWQLLCNLEMKREVPPENLQQWRQG
jgi:hypothetical protein